MILEVRDLSFSYGDHRVLDSLDLKISDGDMVALLGKNGAGKTTLLRLIPSFLKCTQGTISIDSVPVKDLKTEDKIPFGGPDITVYRIPDEYIYDGYPPHKEQNKLGDDPDPCA